MGAISVNVLSPMQIHLESPQQADVQTRLLQQINQIQLYKALGGGWKADTSS